LFQVPKKKRKGVKGMKVAKKQPLGGLGGLGGLCGCGTTKPFTKACGGGAQLCKDL
jgi:hypothetical protein